MLYLDVDRERVDLFRHDGDHKLLETKRDEGTYQCDGPIHNLVELVLGLTDENLSPAFCGLRATEILDAAYRSSVSGREESV